MQQLTNRAIVRVLISIGMALALLMFVLGTFGASAKSTHLTHLGEPIKQPAHSQVNKFRNASSILQTSTQKAVITSTGTDGEGRVIGVGPIFAPPLLAWAETILNDNELQATSGDLSVEVSATTGLDDTSTVYENGMITYKIMLTNNTDEPIDDIEVLALLPENGDPDDVRVDNVECTKPTDCFLGVLTKTVPIILPVGSGTELSITSTYRISWTEVSVARKDTVELEYSVRVSCQPPGTILTNRVLILYDSGGDNDQVQIQVQPVPPAQNGKLALSSGPVRCSEPNLNSANGLDVGDFDADGDLDLAVASFLGTAVYRNDGNTVFEFTINLSPTTNVRWGDFDNDGTLELLSIGDWTGNLGPTCCTGFNYLYKYNGNDFGSPIDSNRDGYTFLSGDTLADAAVADYDGDGYLDLATASIFDGCYLRLYRNIYKDNRPPNPKYFEETLISSPNLPCFSFGRAYSVAWGDYDNDGDQDLAVGFRSGQAISRVQILRNEVGTITTVGSITVQDDSLDQNPLELAWGDYDNDGYLDLAASFTTGSYDTENFASSVTGQVLIYHNNKGNSFSVVTPPILSSTPKASIDWGDFDGDGSLELAVIAFNDRPRFYRYNGATFSEITGLQTVPLNGAPFGVRGMDYDNDGDLDLAIANRNGRSVLYATFAPRLSTTLIPIPGLFHSNSVAWGDYDGDSNLDLFFGGASGEGNSKLYTSSRGQFSLPSVDYLGFSGNGPHAVAFGNVDSGNTDFDLDIAVGTAGGVHTFLDDQFGVDLIHSSNAISSVVWGDVDGDGDLDLLAGGEEPPLLFLNDAGTLVEPPKPLSTLNDPIRSLAWGDFNNDFYLDFAVGNSNQPNRIYQNNKDNTFSLLWDPSEGPVNDTRSVAWGDYDQDGDLDLAVGNYGQKNYIYQNIDGVLTTTAVTAISDHVFKTTSVAWGDWDNDGDLDLAVGNDGEADQVFNNLNEETGSPDFAWRWTSGDTRRTTGVAWGDKDGDGDLDLAVSRKDGQNGIYENTYIMPSHLTDEFTRTAPLPNNPSYLSIERPGNTNEAFFFSSSEIITLSIIPIEFGAFDPDGTRYNSPSNEYGDDLVLNKTIYEFSLDGGSTWHPAQGELTPTPNYSDTRREGAQYSFSWNAEADSAVSDNARFRISIVNHLGQVDTDPERRAGLNQRATVSAVSPPFRLRAPICSWPRNPSIAILNSTIPLSVGTSYNFFGDVTNISAAGNLTFTWDFDDENPPRDPMQLTPHTFQSSGLYTITLRVTGEPCPNVPYEVIARQAFLVGLTFTPTDRLYLPLVQRTGGEANETTGNEILTLSLNPAAPQQITGLTGETEVRAGVTHLSWQARLPEEAVVGYRVYRANVGETTFRRLAELPPNITTYTDNAATCEQMYLVTAYNAAGESLPSTSSYFSPPCR